MCKNVGFKCSQSYLESHSDVKTYAKPVSQLADDDEEASLTASLQQVLPIGAIRCDENTVLTASSEPVVTRYGMWLKVSKVHTFTKF